MLNENDILYDEAPELTAEVEQLNSTLQLNKEETLSEVYRLLHVVANEYTGGVVNQLPKNVVDQFNKLIATLN